MFVRDLMTSPATSLPTGARLDDAITVLATQHIIAVPLVDARDHVVGIVTEADVLKDSIPSEGSLVPPVEVPHLRTEARRLDEWDVLVVAGVVTVLGPQQANDIRLATAIAQTIPGAPGVVVNPLDEAADQSGLELRRLHGRPPAHTTP